MHRDAKQLVRNHHRAVLIPNCPPFRERAQVQKVGIRVEELEHVVDLHNHLGVICPLDVIVRVRQVEPRLVQCSEARIVVIHTHGTILDEERSELDVPGREKPFSDKRLVFNKAQ